MQVPSFHIELKFDLTDFAIVGEPGRARESPGERRRAWESAGERGRARESPGERGRARESPIPQPLPACTPSNKPNVKCKRRYVPWRTPGCPSVQMRFRGMQTPTTQKTSIKPSKKCMALALPSQLRHYWVLMERLWSQTKRRFWITLTQC